jgi:hypothetical protein
VVIERRAREVRGAVVCAKEIRGEAVYATDLGRKIEYKYWLGCAASASLRTTNI